MQRPRYSANGLFLGVVEDEKSHMVGRHTMNVITDADFRINSRDAMHKKSPTQIYHVLERGIFGIALDLIFTDRSIHDKFQLFYNTGSGPGSGLRPVIQVNKLLNIDSNRANRTILEVQIKGIDKIMVLKCIDCKRKDVVEDSVETVTQQEVKAFEALPDSLKGIFVEKYGHGRLWFSDLDHCEVILMEKMCSTDLNQAFTTVKYDKDDPNSVSEQLKWLSEGFGLLHKVHEAGFSHGDPHAANLLWTDDVGQGTMKFIDPERMLNLNLEGTDNVTKAIRKLSDVGYLLFRNVLTLMGLNSGQNIECGTLHRRLKQIKTRLVEHFVFLDDTLPYTDYYLYASLWNMGQSKEKWRIHNPIQYEKMKTDDFCRNLDVFISNMSDAQYLQKVFHYTILEINRAALRFPAVDDKDLDVPYYPGQVAAVLPVQVTSQPEHQVIKPPNADVAAPRHFATQPNTGPGRELVDFPLRYGIFDIQVYDDINHKFHNIYYKKNPNETKSLIEYDGKIHKPFNGYTIQRMYASGSNMSARYDMEDLYFNFDYEKGDLIVYKPNPSMANNYVLVRKIRNRDLSNYPNFGS